LGDALAYVRETIIPRIVVASGELLGHTASAKASFEFVETRMRELRVNRVKQKITLGEVAVGVMGPGMSPDLVDVLGPLGFDAVWLEGEHGPVDFGDIADLTRAADLWGMTSIVRVNENRYGPIYRTLDLGAQGVCVPHVNTREEAQAVADAAKFLPLGKRGIATSRQGYGVSNFLEAANDQSLAMILIEDIVAVENLDEILEVEGVDLFYVAPGDLGQSLGYMDRSHPEVLDTVDRALKTIVASGRPAGTLVTTESIARYIDLGVNFVTAAFMPWLARGADDLLGLAGAGE